MSRVRSVVILMGVLSGSASAQLPAPACTTDQIAPSDTGWVTNEIVVDREDIERWGWSRVSELVQRSDWTLSSIDGFFVDASADGLPVSRLSKAGRTDWVVVIDGQRVPVRMDGLGALESLPVAITQIDRVTITRLPMLAAGRVATRGVIEIRTRRVDRAALRGMYQIGNERGDPGPYRYTDLNTINVERLGPDGAVTAFLGNGSADLQASARYSSLNVTDAEIFPRIEGISGERAHHHQLTAASGRAGFSVACSRHDLVAGASRFDGLLFGERPTADGWARSTTAHIGVSGSASLGSRLFLGYSLTHSRFEQDTLAGTRPAWMTGERATSGASVNLTANTGRSQWGVSGAAARWSVARENAATLSQNDATAQATFSHLRDRVAFDVLGELALHNGAVEPRHLSARVSARVDSVSAMRLAAGHSRLFPDGEAWSETLLLQEASNVDPTITFADAAWKRLLPQGAIEVALGVTHAERWTIITEDRGAATLLSARASLRLTPHPFIAAALDYRLARASASVSAIRDALRSTPRHQARVSVGTPHLAGNFRLSASLSVRSATEWIQTDSAGALAVRELEPMARVDATLEKRLWRERLRTYVAARNLFDRTERYHGAGAHFGLRVHVGVELDLRVSGSPTANAHP